VNRQDPATSLGETVYASLRSDILAGHILPGSKLNIRAIAQETGVSLSVVREALRRLSGEHLVVAEPQLGFSVVPLDLEDLQDLTRVRILIEGAAIHDSVKAGDVEYEARILAAHHRMSRQTYLASEGNNVITEEWAQAHADFHTALLSAAPSRRLRELAARLRDASELYRRWAGPFDVPTHPPRDVAAEHQELLTAAIGGDADRAAALIKDHIARTAATLTEYVMGISTLTASPGDEADRWGKSGSGEVPLSDGEQLAGAESSG
jgi:DNA-binding GntR family transcriptional regulator